MAVFVFLHCFVTGHASSGAGSSVSLRFTCWTPRRPDPSRWRTRQRYASDRLRWNGDHTEWVRSVTAAGPRREGLVRVLGAVREAARSQADDVLRHVPDTGDSATGRAVDDFVDQAADALRALDEAVAETLSALAVERS
jgi:hypothetical protein